MVDHIAPPDRRMLTDEERAQLNAWADSQGAPKVMWQVYDDSDAKYDDECGAIEAGEPFEDPDAAVEWGGKQGFKFWSAYRVTRCVTRDRKIWYMQVGSPYYSAN